MKRPRHGITAVLWVLAGLAGASVQGCGVLNPSLVTTLTFGQQAGSFTAPKGNVVLLVMNLSTVTTQANLRVTREDGGQVTLNIAVPTNEYRAFTQECDIQQIEFVQASFVATTGPIQIPFSVPRLEMGVNLNCGDVVSIIMFGSPPNVSPQVQVY